MSETNKFSIEMLSIGTEVSDDGKIEPILSVQFTTPNGTFRYPWKHLKETVGNWMKIEEVNNEQQRVES
jgi:hypothetical protein